MNHSIAPSAALADYAPLAPRPLLFLHIPKTAGTSFLVMLQNLFGDHRVLRLGLETPDLRARLDALAGGEDTAYSCVNGHLPAHMFSAQLDRYEAFTLLRHPVARVMSLYRFLRRHSAEHLAAMGLPAKFSFDEFIESRSPQVYEQVHNGMTRMLCDLPAATNSKTTMFWTLAEQPAALDSAMQTLERIEFGLVEQFEQTHRLLRERWGIPYAMAPMRLNTTASDDLEGDIGRIRRIVERNTLDIALYEAATALFALRGRVSTRPPSTMRNDAVFAPPANTRVNLGDVPGRQGFHPFEKIGLAWIDGTGPARVYFRPPAPAARIELSLFTVADHFPADRIRLRLDGHAVPTSIATRDPRWLTLSTGMLPLEAALHELSIDVPYAVPVRFLEPGSVDARELGLAVAAITLGT